MHSTIMPLSQLQKLIDEPSVSVNECYFVMADSGVMSWRAVKQEFVRIVQEYGEWDNDPEYYSRSEWLPIVMHQNEEDTELWCSHTNERIPSLMED